MSLPIDLEAEQSCIAAAIALPEAAQVVTEMLSPADFWDQPLAAACGAIAECVRTGTRVSSAIVIHAMSRHMEQIDAEAALYAAQRALSVPQGVEYWARIVRDKAIARRLVQAATNLHAEANSGEDMEAVIASHEAAIAAVRSTTRFDEGATDADEVGARLEERLEAFMENPKAIHGITTGWASFDSHTDGLQPQTFVGIGAATSVGKSLICHNLLRQLSGRDHKPVPTLLFTTEMAAEQVQSRLVWMEAGIDPQQVKSRGGMTTGEKERVWAAQANVRSWPIRYRFHGGPTVDRIRSEARRDKARRGTQIVVVDHIGHVVAPGRDTKEKRTNAAQGLKQITMDEGVTIIATCHVNREGVKAGGWLSLWNFADTSDLEKEMDVAILGTPCMDMGQVYAPIEDRRAKDLIAEEGAGFLMLDIAKNRNGATGMVPMRLDWWTGGGRFSQAARKGIGA